MRFVDRVKIWVQAGDGGDGCVAWRREAHVPLGGPAGGDGGNGGDILVVADSQLSTLMDLRYRSRFIAERGVHGRGKSQHGKGAEVAVVRVPVGTSVYYEGDDAPADAGGLTDDFDYESEGIKNVHVGAPTSEQLVIPEDADLLGPQPLPPREHAPEPELGVGDLIGDLTEDGQQLLVARGGLGGRGNTKFRSGLDRAPEKSEPGGVGEGRWLRIELKLLADVGIVGFPNVGKSTLISKISAAKPEIGSYPFTTLTPQLGFVELSGYRTMVVADVPGLIKGASTGKGLGHEFLRHLERTRVLLHLLAPDYGEGRNPIDDLDALELELKQYGDMFEGRPRVVALNKQDTPEGQALLQETKKRLAGRRIPVFPISASTGEGTEPLLEALWRRLVIVKQAEKP